MLSVLRKRKKRKKSPGREMKPRPTVPGSVEFRRSLSELCLPTSPALALIIVVTIQALTVPASSLIAKQKKKVSRTVTGVVLDKDENGISGATVELTDLQTNKKIAIFSQEGGRYQFADLQPTHDYEVRASYKGLSSEARKFSSFDNRNEIVLNLTLSPTK